MTLTALALLVLTLVLFSWSGNYYLSIIALVLAGTAMTSFTSTDQTLLQQHTDDTHRGRVMSLYTITIIGLAPLGALPLGALSDAIGAPRAIFVVALVVGAAVVVLARRLWRLD